MENYECVTYLCPKTTPMVSSDFLLVGFVILVEKQKLEHVCGLIRSFISHLTVTSKNVLQYLQFSTNSIIKVHYSRPVVLSWLELSDTSTLIQYWNNTCS